MHESKVVSIEKLMPILKAQLAAGGSVRFRPTGVSMLPLLDEKRDYVVLEAGRPVKKYDIILYTRKDGSYVLHRVIGEKADGYVLCGDNQIFYEYPVPQDRVIGVVSAIYQGEKRIAVQDLSYRLYSFFRVKRQYCKRQMRRVKLKLKKMLAR